MPWRIVSGTPTIGNMCIFPGQPWSPLLAIFLYTCFAGNNLPSGVTMPLIRPLHEEHSCTTACNDADSGPTLRTGVRGISLAAPLHAQAWPKVQTGLLP